MREDERSCRIESVFNRYTDMVYRIALNQLKNVQQAEDITQDVFMKLVEADEDFTSEEHQKAWLIRVTLNLCKSQYRLAWYKRRSDFPEQIEAQETIELSLQEREIKNLLFQLNGTDRNLIYLYFYEGYTIPELANLLHCNKNTLAARFQRAKKKLKKYLEDEYEM